MMQKQEFLELFEAATRAAKSASGDNNSPEVTRCLEAMNRLKKAPQTLACDVVYTTSIGKNHNVFIDHINPRIRSEAKQLWNLWLTYLYATGTKRSKSCGESGRQSPVKKCVEMSTTGDSKRDKVRESLVTSLSKVANEVVEKDMQKRVASCDPSSVAIYVESAMFEKLGCFLGRQKLKYRSILFNMGDSHNPDLRRKVLIGEINGERLVSMEREEMASHKIQMEVKQIKEKARIREDNRIKMMMMMNQSDMIVT